MKKNYDLQYRKGRRTFGQAAGFLLLVLAIVIILQHERIEKWSFFDNADLYGIKSGAGSGGLKRRKGSCKEKGSPHSESY